MVIEEFRLKSGWVDAATLEADTASIVESFPITAPFIGGTFWGMDVPEPTRGTLIQGLNHVGGNYGTFTGQLLFYTLTPSQVQYLISDIFIDKPTALVTFSYYSPIFQWAVINATLLFPTNLASQGERFTFATLSNTAFNYVNGRLADGTLVGDYGDDYGLDYS